MGNILYLKLPYVKLFFNIIILFIMGNTFTPIFLIPQGMRLCRIFIKIFPEWGINGILLSAFSLVIAFSSKFNIALTTTLVSFCCLSMLLILWNCH